MSTAIPVISLTEFSVAYALRPNTVAWFLGAGTSAASGIPTGYAMIRDFKAQIFCRENNIPKREIDTGDPVWIERIDSYFRHSSLLPPNGDPSEYAAAFEAVYPQAIHRRQYIEDAISKGIPSFGHRALGSLIAARKVDCVFTTNFDPLVEESTQFATALLPRESQVRPTVADIDSSERAMRCLNESDWPLIAKLHGDYRSIAIKNTGSELERQDERMRHVLVEVSKRFGMIFVGYSGRDASVMEALNSVLQETAHFPNGLYWVTASSRQMLPSVTRFLENAHLAGVKVSVVECNTFDELAADIIKHVDLTQALMEHVMQRQAAPRLVPVKLPEQEARRLPVLRFSALLIESLPQVARRITLARATTSPNVRALLKEQRCRAVVAANGRELAVFGNDKEVLTALASLSPKLSGAVALDATKNSWALGLLYEALVKALSRDRPVIPRFKRLGHSLVIGAPRDGEDANRVQRRFEELASLRTAYASALTGKVDRLGYPFQEGVFLKLEQIEERWWCGFEPYTFVDVPREVPPKQSPASSANAFDDGLGVLQERYVGDPAGDWRRERWAMRHNKEWAAIIDAWATMLTSTRSGTVCAFELEDGAGVDAVFAINRFTGWSRPSHHDPYFNRTS